MDGKDTAVTGTEKRVVGSGDGCGGRIGIGCSKQEEICLTCEDIYDDRVRSWREQIVDCAPTVYRTHHVRHGHLPSNFYRALVRFLICLRNPWPPL